MKKTYMQKMVAKDILGSATGSQSDSALDSMVVSI
jgi:hypothetical protein